MAVLSVPVTKGKSKLDIDTDRLPEIVFKEALIQGLKVILNRGGTKVNKEAYPDPEMLKVAAMEVAEKNLTAMYEGKIRIMGAKADKVSGAVMTEARRLARAVVKDELKKAGHKISYIAASEITKAANALIAADPSFVDKASANLEMLVAEGEAQAQALGGIISAVPIDEKKKAAAEAKKAAAKETLSAIQAGKPKKHKPEAAVQQ